MDNSLATRIQDYLVADRCAHAEATQRVLLVGLCALVLDSSGDAVTRNLAYPCITSESEAVGAWLPDLHARFAAADRRPGLQWVDAALPHLAEDLSAFGFHEHSREAVFACTPAMLRPPAPLPELTMVVLDDTSPIEEVRSNLDTNEFGFDPTSAQPATDAKAAEFRATLDHAKAFTARWDGQAAGAGMYTDPASGTAELVGIATLESFRGRGIAAALAAYMAQAAFASGCDLVYLTTTNPTAMRVYQRIGFARVGDLLTYTLT